MHLDQVKSYILKNLFTGLTKTSITLILSVVAVPLTIKFIGVEQYGVISIVLLFSSFSGVLDLGLSKSLVSIQGEGKEKEKSAIYIINFSLFFIVTIVALVIYSFDINLFGSRLEVHQRTLRLINSIAVFLLALSILNNMLRASLEANFELDKVNWGFLIQSGIINLGWLFLGYIDASLVYFLFIPILSSITTILYHLILLPPIYTTLKKPDKKSFKNVSNITLQFFQVGSLNSLHLPLVKYSIVYFIGEGRAIGIFELSTKLSILGNTILSYISNPLFSISSKHKKENLNYLWKLVNKVTKLLLIISAVGFFVYLSISKYLILYFFKEYSTVIFNVLTLVLIGYLFVAASESLQKFYLGIGRVKLVIYVKLIAILLNILGIIVASAFQILSVKSITLIFSLSLTFTGIVWITASFIMKRNKLMKAR